LCGQPSLHYCSAHAFPVSPQFAWLAERVLPYWWSDDLHAAMRFPSPANVCSMVCSGAQRLVHLESLFSELAQILLGQAVLLPLDEPSIIRLQLPAEVIGLHVFPRERDEFLHVRILPLASTEIFLPARPLELAQWFVVLAYI